MFALQKKAGFFIFFFLEISVKFLEKFHWD